MPFSRDLLRAKAAELAAQGVFIGTSSWKYQGWCGQLYEEARYIYRGKMAESRFQKNCLREYAEVFKTVSVDAAYYSFPSEKYLSDLASQVPPDFLFGIKVTDEITVKRFPNLPRFGLRAGKPNEHFLNAQLFNHAFLKPCESIRPNIGVLMFEFSRFYNTDYEHGRDFVASLDQFFSQLPKGWPYGIEIRNRNWLTPEYFACLTRHGIAHVYNSWEAMPPVSEQIALPGSRTNPQLTAARFLLKPGRKFEEAVNLFKPYGKLKEINQDARQAGSSLLKQGKSDSSGRTLIFINNRLEGNALETITAMLDSLNA
ncbi:MAG: hypothetical protein JWM04_2346 [Verrucomicrobiales bacterium]|nr:hypothetical protein [Verrucomicrobiales bacterium]